ncbi:hypothetical protein NEOLEDRAFT_1070042, partial [Neolentinus lepideus HHB14362 ss-1]
DQNRMRRLSFHPDEEGAYEEMILRVQGVISAMDLPPHHSACSIRPKQNFKKGFLQQSVQLTGYSNPEFQKNIDGLNLIARHIGRSFKEGVLLKWEPIDGDVRPTLSIMNKYFTSTRFTQKNNTVPFDKVVDPRGILTKLQDEKFIHTEDNQVTYYKVIVADNGRLQYTNMDPAAFRTGDIAEVEFSIIAVPQQERYRMGLVLRSITLLDAQHTEVCEIDLKRRVGHEDSIVRDARQKMSKWQIRQTGEEEEMST